MKCKLKQLAALYFHLGAIGFWTVIKGFCI